MKAAPTVSTPADTSIEQADAIVAQLAGRKDAWLQVSVSERITYLRRCIQDVWAIAPEWAAVSCQAKGIDPSAPLAGEEWLVGPVATLSMLRSLIHTLQANGQPKPSRWTIRRGQTVAQVFPDNWMDQLLWAGFCGEVWMQPGQPPTQGKVYQTKPEAGQVALVLGAGNVSSIAVLDALYKLFTDDAVVLLKLNPVNVYLGPVFEQAFRALRQAGFLQIVYGGAEVGRYLCQHPTIDTLHITGSHRTHDAIVWGAAVEEQAARKATRQPLNSKPITSELGCVTPVLVVPGAWSDAELAYHARHIAGMVVHNASFNCAAAQVIVTARGWSQRSAFLQQLRQALAAVPPRQPYYPGAQDRYAAFLQQYPQAEALGYGDAVPWTLISEVPAQPGEYALTQEAFCGVVAEVPLEAADAETFLAIAVPFVNQTVWGNLSCTLLVDPRTEKRCLEQVEQAIADLHYGAIGVNVWSAVVYTTPSLTWGAFPGNPIDDIASGCGVVHNTYLFNHPQKSVLRAPFRMSPTPLWFPQRRHLLAIAQRLAAFHANSTWRNLMRVLLAAIRP